MPDGAAAPTTSETITERLSKDDLILGMLAALGGERASVNERDLFLAAWHAFPNTMRWTDTALPNPDTFTASLRRLDARKLIVREGKQQRKKRRSTRKTVLDVARSGVVKARLADDALERSGVSADDVALIRALSPPAETYASVPPEVLVAACVAMREQDGRPSDEGAIVETAFHKFPALFAYEFRPEFPNVEAVRDGISAAVGDDLLTKQLALTDRGRERIGAREGLAAVRADPSTANQRTGALRLAARIEETPGYQMFRENGTLYATKGDELFRALRVPPTTDVRPIADALKQRARELRRVDKGQLAEYLFKLAGRHNPEVLPLLEEADRAIAQEGTEQDG
jgi:hypothetical protein